MSGEPIHCSQCGAPLNLPADVNFVTCGHCHAALEVRREPSAIYTQLVKALDRHANEMSGQLASLRYEQELARIDREWQIERDSYMVHGKHGQSSPSAAGGVVMMIVGTGFGLLWMIVTGTITRDVTGGIGKFIPLFGLVFLLVTVAGDIHSIARANRYQQAEEAYRQRRENALRRNPSIVEIGH